MSPVWRECGSEIRGGLLAVVSGCYVFATALAGVVLGSEVMGYEAIRRG